MDLKNRFLSLGLELPVVEKFLPFITPQEAEIYYDCSDDELRKKIPQLLERIVNKSFIEEELDFNNIGLKTPGGDIKSEEQSESPFPPQTTGFTKPELNRPKLAAKPEKKVTGCLFSIIGFIMLIGGGFILIRETQTKSEAQKAQTVLKDVKTPTDPTPVPQELKPVQLEQHLPQPPAFRGSWMFMPWDNFEPSIVCSDGRFKGIHDKYTIQFWMKITQKIPEKVAIVTILGSKSPAESIFMNEDGLICFNPGNSYPNLALRKRIPDNGRHFHIAATREGNICRLFVNGKLRQESAIEFNEEAVERDFLILFNSKSTLKGLAIDELMISDEVLFHKNFHPERILTMSQSTVLYMPFEKHDGNSIQCFGNSHFQNYYPSGGKWLNVLNEVQQVINHIEFSEETKALQSSPSEP